MWIDCDDDHVIVNTEVHRAKYKNLTADPRVAITIWKTGDPTAYFEVRGTVAGVVIGDEAKAHLDSLAQRYFKVDEYPYPIETQRAIVRIAPDRIVAFPRRGVGASRRRYDCAPAMFTIQLTPNLSTHMPNVSPHGAFSSGSETSPPSDSFSQ